MKRILQYLTLVVLGLLVSACLPDKATGFYDAENHDFLLIKKDGHVLWSPMAKTMSDAESLGVLSFNKKTKEAHLVMASASPWVGTQLRYSTDCQKIFIDWKRIDGGEPKSRATEYTKRN